MFRLRPVRCRRLNWMIAFPDGDAVLGLRFAPAVLPGGVIGNTEGFGPSIPGSSPGRVVAEKKVIGRRS